MGNHLVSTCYIPGPDLTISHRSTPSISLTLRWATNKKNEAQVDSGNVPKIRANYQRSQSLNQSSSKTWPLLVAARKPDILVPHVGHRSL